MNRFFRVVIPLLLGIGILLSIGWYLLEYDTDFTQDLLLQQARRLEENGSYKAAVWFYDLAYRQSAHNDQVAIELAQHFKAQGNYTKAEYTLSSAIRDGATLDLYIALCQTFLEQDKLLDAVQMLSKVTNPEIKAQLDEMRPQAPDTSHPSGFYTEYLSVSLQAEAGTIYYCTDGDYPSLKTDAYTAPVILSGGETTLWAVTLAENGLVSLPAVYSYTVGSVVEEVTFADMAFEAAIRQALNISGDRIIYSNELWNMTAFSVPAAAASCQDLKWLTGLKSLSLENCAVDSLQILESLTQLETVTIVNSALTTKDILSIASLPKLTKLTISGCGLSSMESLRAASGLTYLDLSNNTIRDTSALLDMPNLTQLYLSHNALVSLEDMTHLHNLQVLEVAYNSIVSTAPAGNLVNLKKLDVSGNELLKLEGLEALTELEEFSAAYNQLIDVNILSGCTKIQKLDISNNHLLNIGAVAGFASLKELNFSHNEVTNLPAFTSSSLVSINGSYNLLRSLDALSGQTELRFVYMDYNASIRSIYPLTSCKALEIVNIYDTGVTDVSALTAMGVVVHYKPF